MLQQKMTPTTKTIDDLVQLFQGDRLNLNPDYQRNSVWPPKARSYLVDTILNDKPIPMLFFSRIRDANSNRLCYKVIDGQQRLRAIIEYLNDDFASSESPNELISKKKFSHLPKEYQEQFIGYSFVVMEMAGYSDSDLKDIFTRINKYVVRLSPQELRDANAEGPFKRYIDSLSAHKVWKDLQLFSKQVVARKRNKEFIAELVILRLEGPQDKKGSLDLYYSAADEQLDDLQHVINEVQHAAELAHALTFELEYTHFKKLPGFYALMGALFTLPGEIRKRIPKTPHEFSEKLHRFCQCLEQTAISENSYGTFRPEQVRLARRFHTSMSQQTDNIKPRRARIETLINVFSEPSWG